MQSVRLILTCTRLIRVQILTRFWPLAGRPTAIYTAVFARGLAVPLADGRRNLGSPSSNRVAARV